MYKQARKYDIVSCVCFVVTIPLMGNDWHKTENVFVFDVIHEENNVTFDLYIFEGISALIEIPKNCVVAAVGKELSEYVSSLFFFFF